MTTDNRITVRTRTDNDLEECATLLIEVHELDGYPVEGVADPLGWLTPPDLLHAWVGQLDNRIVGHVLAATPSPHDDAASLWTAQSGQPIETVAVLARLFVGPNGRGHGVGEQLVRAVMDYAQSRSLRLVLDVMDKDKTATRLYERLGWEYIGDARHQFGANQTTLAHCYVSPSS